MEHLYINSRDETRIHLVRWASSGDPVGDILICHGLAEHMDRYQHVAERLLKDGWRVTGLELRGHGDSEGKRGHVMRWTEYNDDLRAAAEAINGPHFLLGHSMGGLVVLDALREPWPHPVRGVVLSNPMLAYAVEAPRWKLVLGRFLSGLLPSLSMGNEVDANVLSHDPEVVAAYVKDPRVFRTITPRWYTESLVAMERVNAHASAYGLPLLALTSTADKLCDHTMTSDFVARYGALGQRKCFGALYHELFNEPEKERVFDEMCGWLAARREP